MGTVLKMVVCLATTQVASFPQLPLTTPTNIALFWPFLGGASPASPSSASLSKALKRYHLHKVNTHPTYVCNCKPKYLLSTVHGRLWGRHHHPWGCRLLPSTRNKPPRSPHSYLTIKNISRQTRLTTSNARIEVLLLKGKKLTWFSLRSNFPSAVHILPQKLRCSIAATHSSTANKRMHLLLQN